MRSVAQCVTDNHGISRFPCEMLTCMHGVFDRAGSRRASRSRRARCCLPPASTASAPRSTRFRGAWLSRLDTQPARSPVNASPPRLPATAHDSGPVWVGRVGQWRVPDTPAFPPSPLKFRTAGFPQYGFKAGYQAGPSCQTAHTVGPQFVSTLRAVRRGAVISALSRRGPSRSTPPCEQPLLLYPRGPRSDTGFAVPHLHRLLGLIRPTRRHDTTSPLCGLYASLSRRRVVPCFRCTLLPDMPSSSTPGSPSAARAQFLRRRRWSSPRLERLDTPISPTIRFKWDGDFEASQVRISLRPVGLLASLADPTEHLAQPTEAFTSGLSTGRSLFPSPGMTTAATGQVPPAGLSPAGTAASIAAPSLSPYETFIHSISPV
jgi:hypothetical protein